MASHLKFIAAALLMLAVILMVNQPVLADSGAPVGAAQQTTPQGVDLGRYGIGWGGLALINAGLAQGKNRKGLNWFLISLLLGPFATLLLVAFFRKLPSTATP